MTYAEIIDAAGKALRRVSDEPVELEFADVVVDYPGAAAVLIRARVLHRAGQPPSTVMIEKSNTRYGVEMEWAGPAFVTERPAIRSAVPRLLAGDADAKLLVMTDLDGPGVRRGGDLRFEEPNAHAETVLAQAQVLVAELHVSGLGQRDGYEWARAQRGGARASGHPINPPRAQLSELPRILADRLHHRVSPQVEREVQAAGSEVFEPGGFTTMPHGDPTGETCSIHRQPA